MDASPRHGRGPFQPSPSRGLGEKGLTPPAHGGGTGTHRGRRTPVWDKTEGFVATRGRGAVPAGLAAEGTRARASGVLAEGRACTSPRWKGEAWEDPGGGSLAGRSPRCKVGIWGGVSAEQAAGAAAGSSRAGLGASPGDVVPQATTSATWPLRLSFRQQRRRAPQGAHGQGGRPGHRSPQGTLPGGRPGLQASRPPSPVTSVHCMSAVTAAQLLPQGQ